MDADLGEDGVAASVRRGCNCDLIAMSMLSLAPAARMFGCRWSIATAGSFCFFCENGPVGLPLKTLVSCAAAGAASASDTTTPSKDAA